MIFQKINKTPSLTIEKSKLIFELEDSFPFSTNDKNLELKSTFNPKTLKQTLEALKITEIISGPKTKVKQTIINKRLNLIYVSKPSASEEIKQIH